MPKDIRSRDTKEPVGDLVTTSLWRVAVDVTNLYVLIAEALRESGQAVLADRIDEQLHRDVARFKTELDALAATGDPAAIEALAWFRDLAPELMNDNRANRLRGN
jgi:hypothetical protein